MNKLVKSFDIEIFGSDWGNFSKVNYGGTYPFLVWSATVHWPLNLQFNI